MAATRIGTWGDSAGAHLALMAALTDPGIRCTAGWYSLTDIGALDHLDAADTTAGRLLGGHDLLTAAGARSGLRIVPGADHCFTGYADIGGLLAETTDFLRAHL